MDSKGGFKLPAYMLLMQAHNVQCLRPHGQRNQETKFNRAKVSFITCIVNTLYTIQSSTYLNLYLTFAEKGRLLLMDGWMDISEL